MLLVDAREQFAKGKKGGLFSQVGAGVQAQMSGFLGASVSANGRAKAERSLPVVSDVKDYVFLVIGSGGEKLHERLISLSFDDTEAVLRGSMTIRNQDFRDKPTLREGDKVELHYAPIYTENWAHWWTMRCVKPAVTYQSGEETYTLASDLDRLNSSTDDFQYKQSKKKKFWFAHEIINDICEKYRIRHVVVKTQHHFLDMVREGSSPMDVINEVLDVERSTTGRRYAVWFETVTGTLWVQPRTRQVALYKLAGACMEAQMQIYLHERFATALTIRGPKFTDAGKDVTKHDRTDTGKNTASGTAGGGAGSSTSSPSPSNPGAFADQGGSQ